MPDVKAVIDCTTGVTTIVPFTAPETAARAAEQPAILAQQAAEASALVNAATLRGKASAALTTNATYLAMATPSAAQNTAQTKALTRQMNALIKLTLDILDDVNGT